MAITIALLRQAGATVDLIARVCELEEQERVRHRRTQVREAVRRHRRGNQCNDYSDYNDYTNPETKNPNDINGRVINSPLTSSEVPTLLTSLTSSSEFPQRKKEIVEGRRGTRLPADFAPDTKTMEVFRAELPGADLDRVLAEFRDYWTAVPGQRGTKRDWQATARNRFRQIAGLKPKGNGHGNGQPLRPGSKEDRREEWYRASKALRDSADRPRGGGGDGAESVGRLPEPQRRA